MRTSWKCACWCLALLISSATAQAAKPFAIQVVDEATGRGVPAMFLKTTPGEIYVTDSNGYVAVDDPTYMGRQVYFHVSGDGYEHSQGFLGYRGASLSVKPGGEATVKVKRLNVAERLYRITGAGIYRDTVKLRKKSPIKNPLLSEEVCGQDTVQAVVKGDDVYWFFGDTNRLAQPLGNFNTSGAVSKLPGKGGLKPDAGINLKYFTDEDGFSRPMFQREPGVLIWVHGAFSVDGPDGKPRIVTHYSRRKDLGNELSSGVAVLNEKTSLFETLRECAEGELHPMGQSFRFAEDGVEYIGFANPYPLVRVRADWEAVMDPTQWEAYTPLVEGTRWSGGDTQVDRTADGKLNLAWKKNTGFVNANQMLELQRKKLVTEEENWLHTVDSADGSRIGLHAGSVKWNEHRQRWVMIAHQGFGKPSNLGEVWYLEAKQPEGPYHKGVRIISHQKYSFYNVTQNEFFDEEGGKRIYLQGTYTNMFTDAEPTPWYEYNQMMYRLDLSDPRLQAAFVE